MSQGNFYFCLDYPKVFITLNWLRGQSLTCVLSAKHHGIRPARLTPDRANRAFEELCTISCSGCASEGTRDLCFYRHALPPAVNAWLTAGLHALARSRLSSLRQYSALRRCPQLLLSNYAPYPKENILAHYKVFVLGGAELEKHTGLMLYNVRNAFSQAHLVCRWHIPIPDSHKGHQVLGTRSIAGSTHLFLFTSLPWHSNI